MINNESGANTQIEYKINPSNLKEVLFVSQVHPAGNAYHKLLECRTEKEAKLISASPKMLNALIAGESELKVFVEENEENEGARIALRFMQSAIAEATKI